MCVATYRHSHPGYAVVTFTCFAWLYFNLDSLDGKHARNTKNSSPLGELFDHACDNLTTAMATVAMFWLLGVEDERLLWVITCATSLSFCHEHLVAYASTDKTIRFGFLYGPGEVIIYGLLTVNLHYLGMMTDVWAAFVGVVSGINGINWPAGALVDYGEHPPSHQVFETLILFLYVFRDSFFICRRVGYCLLAHLRCHTHVYIRPHVAKGTLSDKVTHPNHLFNMVCYL